jgi:hypothetical protein
MEIGVGINLGNTNSGGVAMIEGSPGGARRPAVIPIHGDDDGNHDGGGDGGGGRVEGGRRRRRGRKESAATTMTTMPSVVSIVPIVGEGDDDHVEANAL